MPKFARYCVRLLKQKEKEKSEFFCDFPEATEVPKRESNPHSGFPDLDFESSAYQSKKAIKDIV
ncbi:MAG: hypothetical protein WBE11_08440 [Candidatus Aminicenantaceae bacterium]|jgi:hypothetical protein